MPLLHGECQLVQVHVVRRARAAPIQLVIDRHPIPRRRSGRLGMVDGGGLTVESDGFEEQLIRRSPLHDEGEVVPRATDWVAGYSGRNPLMIDVVVDVPLMPAGDPALVAPNVVFSASELIDVELQCL